MVTRKGKAKQVGELLLERQLITQEQLDKALEVQLKEGGLLGQILVKMGFVTDEQIDSCIKEQTENSKKLENVLMELGMLSEDNLQAAHERAKKDGCILVQAFIAMELFGEEDLVSTLVTQFGFPFLQCPESSSRSFGSNHAPVATTHWRAIMRQRRWRGSWAGGVGR